MAHIWPSDHATVFVETTRLSHMLGVNFPEDRLADLATHSRGVGVM